ncbi:hypothetical protein Slin14017_G086540 [Septoria linicola]|nr:hypothetical protein Slin14017_G086540 [Septoria linicola]
MNVAAVSEYALRFLLPQSANPAAKSDWHRLLEYPMLLPDINLKALLHMETSDANSPPHTPGSTVYYVRSLPITVRVLLQVIQVLQERNYKFDELDHWQRMVSHITDLDVTVYLRYIGMSSKVSPWQRHATDLVQRTNGVYGIFMHILAEIDTMAVTACSVYSFPSAATKALRAPDGSLLPPGGYHTSYEPEDKDLVLFHNLHTSGFKGLEQLVDSARAVDYVGSDYQPIQDSTRSIVNRWMRDVCQFGRRHDVELGTDAIPVTDEMEVTWAKQATPATVHGHVLLLVIGDYCPLEAILNPANFWDQPARAVMYLKNTLSRYLALETDSTSPQVVWNAALIMKLAEAGLLPWVDYQYTPKRRPLREESAELLRQNLSALRPLIVPTFEGNVCMIVRNNFVGIYREKGVLLGNKAIVAEHPVNENDCFIQIPLYHPGHDKYHNQALELRRMFDISCMQIPLFLTCLLDNLPWEGKRIDLLETVLNDFRQHWHQSGASAQLENARDDLDKYWKSFAKKRNVQDLHQFKSDWQGAQVSINQSGIVAIYWLKPDGEEVRVTIQGGRNSDLPPPKQTKPKTKGKGKAKAESTEVDDEAIRTIHFLDTGIDIRNS